MGKASRQKRQRRDEVVAPAPLPLLLPSGEPFQPFRLCYTAENLAVAMTAVRSLGCIKPDRRDDDVYRWFSDHEAATLPIGGAVAPGKSLLLGSIRFPDPFDFTGMIAIETHSIERAVVAAGFFAARLPGECRLTRCRVVNIFFTAGSAEARGGTEGLMDVLEEGVAVSDPRPEDVRMRRDLARAQTLQERERIVAARLQSILKQTDFPLVEDFALLPEEAAPPFDALRLTLGLRLMRALKTSARTSDEQLAVLMREIAGGSTAVKALLSALLA